MAQKLIKPKAGKLLIATPLLEDPNFKRGVVLLCEHNAEGTFGFTINRRVKSAISDVIPDFPAGKMPLYIGGPVQMDTIYFLHNKGNLLEGSIDIGNGIYWGGNFEQLKLSVESNLITENDFRFFIGYSGWTAGQLQNEIDEKSWMVAENKYEYTFNVEPELLWSDIVKDFGGEFSLAALFPENPSLN